MNLQKIKNSVVEILLCPKCHNSEVYVQVDHDPDLTDTENEWSCRLCKWHGRTPDTYKYEALIGGKLTALFDALEEARVVIHDDIFQISNKSRGNAYTWLKKWGE